MVHTYNLDAEMLATRARFITDFGLPVVELMDPQPGECILDLGCGDGLLSRKLMDKGCEVIGIDIGKSMIDAAREKGVDARMMNAENMTFREEFDAVFANSSLDWMRHLNKVAESVYRALKPGGRFVGEMGGKGSIKKVISAIRHVMVQNGIEMESVKSWYFPSPAEFSAILGNAGFHIRSIELIERPITLPGDIRDWILMFGRHYLNSWDISEREKYLNDIHDISRESMMNEKGEWIADYVRLRFYAVKPAEQ